MIFRARSLFIDASVDLSRDIYYRTRAYDDAGTRFFINIRRRPFIIYLTMRRFYFTVAVKTISAVTTVQ